MPLLRPTLSLCLLLTACANNPHQERKPGRPSDWKPQRPEPVAPAKPEPKPEVELPELEIDAGIVEDSWPDAEGEFDPYRRIPLTGEAPALSKLGAPREVYVVDAAGLRHVEKGGRALETIDDATSSPVALSPRGNAVAYERSGGEDAGLYSFDLSTQKRVLLSDDPLAYLASGGWSPDGRWLLFRDSDHELALVGAKGQPAEKIWPSRDSTLVGWSPDSRHLLWSFAEGDPSRDRLRLMEASTKTKSICSTDGFFVTDAAFSPSGTELAVSECKDLAPDTCQLRITDLTCTTLATLQDTPAHGVLSWALGGDLVLFHKLGITVSKVEVGGVRQWRWRSEATAGALGDAGWLVVSPTQTHASLTDAKTGAFTLFDLEAGTNREVSKEGCVLCGPFSPDGQTLFVGAPSASAIDLDTETSAALGGPAAGDPVFLGADTVAYVAQAKTTSHRAEHELRMASRSRGAGVTLTTLGKRFDAHELFFAGESADGSAFCTELTAIHTKDGTADGNALTGGRALILWWSDDPKRAPKSFKNLLLADGSTGECFFAP